jgi:hypothetical protein
MGYNQFTINNYRSALAKQCTGKVSEFLNEDLGDMRWIKQEPEILQTIE